jgi:hypothetical protein
MQTATVFPAILVMENSDRFMTTSLVRVTDSKNRMVFEMELQKEIVNQ